MSRLPMIPLLAGLSSGAARALDDGATVTLGAQGHPGQTGPATLSSAGERSGVIIELLNAQACVTQPAYMHPRTCDRFVIPAETSSG